MASRFFIKSMPLAAFLAFALSVPSVSLYYQGLLLDIIIIGLFASAYNIVFGHLGLISMGHGLFFGLGGYISGILITRWHPTIFCLPMGVLAGTAASFLIGLVVFKRLRVGTPALTKMLLVVIFTLGACLVTYYLFLSPLLEYTGGSNGLSHIRDQPLRAPFGLSIDLKSGKLGYYLVAVIGVICIGAINFIMVSPIGSVIHAIRENELRVPFLGHSLFRIQMIAFTLSGFFSAVAGTLFIVRYGIIDLSVFQWVFIFEILTICVIGGRKTTYGPLVGAAIYYVAKDVLSEYTDQWLLIMALVIVTIVLFMPEGIVPRVNIMLRSFKWRVSS